MADAGESLFSRRTVLVTGALVVAFAGLLHLEGRPAWCKYGLGFWTQVSTHCTSQHFLDPYALSHVLHGVIFYWLLRPLAAKVGLAWRMVVAVLAEIGWELLENSPWVIERYRQNTVAFDYSGDSILNSLGDTVAAAIGFALAARFSWKASVALFLTFELWLLFLARDNLTLNIIMLICPIDAIKEWQLGA